MKSENHDYVLIMAGGSGSRLFPRSTPSNPKHFQKIIGDKTLIESTYDRVKKVVRPSHIFVSSNKKYLNLLRKYLPEIPEENYIIEPLKKNTGPATAFATGVIYKKDKDAIIMTTASDHLVLDEDEYERGVNVGLSVIKENPDHILCVGIEPTRPHIGYGYIRRGELFEKRGDYSIYNVVRFVEKPNLKTAKEYIASGNYFWNASYFIWSAEHFLSELQKVDKNIYGSVEKIMNSFGKKDFDFVVDREFQLMDSVAVEYMLIEKTNKLLTLPLEIGWSDVGSWDAVASMADKELHDDSGNYSEGRVLHVDTKNTMVLSHSEEKIVATVGLSDLIIVTTEKATVILPKGRSEEVKKIVENLGSNLI